MAPLGSLNLIPYSFWVGSNLTSEWHQRSFAVHAWPSKVFGKEREGNQSAPLIAEKIPEV